MTQKESKIEAQTAESAVISPGTPQVRVGGVTTYKIQFSENGKPYLQECSKVSLCGVLDIKWLETVVVDKLVYGVVNAEGQFQVRLFLSFLRSVALKRKQKLEFNKNNTSSPALTLSHNHKSIFTASTVVDLRGPFI